MNAPVRMYALYRPNGELVKCRERLKGALNHLEKGMPSDLWNDVWNHRSRPTTAIRCLRKYGWRVTSGTFTPREDR